MRLYDIRALITGIMTKVGDYEEVIGQTKPVAPYTEALGTESHGVYEND